MFLTPLIHRTAFFFDIDGTLAEIQPSPEMAFIPSKVICYLEKVQQRDGAIGLVSGRTVHAVRQLVKPLNCPIMGIHGAEYGDQREDIQLVSTDMEMDAVRDRLKTWLHKVPGIFLEDKELSIAIHYRQVPELGESLRSQLEKILLNYPSLSLLPGKCVLEVKAFQTNKGEAILNLMKMPAFKNRVPLFIGDDLTDETAFAAVNMLGGITIKVGPGETLANYRFDEVKEVHEWIEHLLSEPRNTAAPAYYYGGQ